MPFGDSRCVRRTCTPFAASHSQFTIRPVSINTCQFFNEHPMFNRRKLLSAVSALAIGTPVFHRAVVAAAQQEEDGKLTKESLADAQWVSGLDLTDEQQERVLKAVNSNTQRLAPMRDMAIPELQATAVSFHSPHESQTSGRLAGSINSVDRIGSGEASKYRRRDRVSQCERTRFVAQVAAVDQQKADADLP